MDAKDKTIGGMALPAFWIRLFMALVLYGCLLVFHGYIFGYGDQIEIVPVLYQMDHPGVYPHDFYIQHILDKPIHERWFFVHAIHVMHLFHPWSFFLMHLFFSVLLIMGLDRLASMIIEAPITRWTAILFILLISYNINLGGNELWYNSLIPSVAAKAFAAWAIYFAFLKNWKWAVPMFILVTFVQPLVGIQVILLSFLAALPISKEDFWKQVKIQLVPYLITFLCVLPWLYLLYREHSSGGISDALLFEIIEFRLPHHFFPEYFSKKGYVLLPFLALVGIVVYRVKQTCFSRLIGWVIIGCLVYVLGVEVFHWPVFLSTQWFKSTIWVKAFGFFALFHLIEQWLELKKQTYPGVYSLYQQKWLKIAVPVIALFCLVAIRQMDIGFMENRPYDFPWHDDKTPEKEICLTAGELSNQDDVFIVPPDFSMFKWYSKRNSYVDYKAMIHHKDVLAEWYQRVRVVYGMDLSGRNSAQTLEGAYTDFVTGADENVIGSWRKAGIDFIIVPVGLSLELSEVVRNDRYVIYRLSPAG